MLKGGGNGSLHDSFWHGPYASVVTGKIRAKSVELSDIADELTL
jgi:hypothetical protein